MVKVKAPGIKTKGSIKPAAKQGKVQKNKPKFVPKVKEAIEIAAKDSPLKPKIENSVAKNQPGTKNKNKKNKNKVNKPKGVVSKPEEVINPVEKVITVIQDKEKVPNVNKTNKKQQKVANDLKQQKAQKKPLENKPKKAKVVVAKKPKDANGLTEADLKKIEKKKAKKLAQKLKKQQKKLEPLEGGIPKVNEILKKKKETLVKDKTGLKKKNEKVAEVKTQNDTASTNSKVLAKKEKKAMKRQQIKDQKLEEKKTRDPAVEAATIFVGNLPSNTKRVQLIRLFKDYGPINSIRLRSAGGKVLHKHKQRKEAGSLNAYIVLKDKATATKALALNGADFKGNHVRVTSSLKTAPQSHEKVEAKRTVFVGNLKYTATEESLREIFTSCGEIDYVRCIRDGDKGCKGVAYVCFKAPDAVGLALELNETILDERPIHVERYSVNKLGAKEARDAQAAKETKIKPGAKQRIVGKNQKQNKAGNNKVANNTANKEPKKNEFKGVKVGGLKKKQNLKKKKPNNQMLKLAKKIAPKPKTE